MGMTIDEVLEYLTDFSIYSPYQEAIDKVSAYIEQMQADYETRLKADLKAILVELQLEIEELDSRAGYSGDGMPTFSTDYIRKKKVNELIQQKINLLKAESAEWVDDKCSACGKGIEDLIDSSEWYQNENPKYCPFCGIKIQPYKDKK